jgi:hypothetical protein
VRELLSGGGFRWWIAGGWAVELAGGARRGHADTDVVVLVDELDRIRAQLRAYHLWEAHDGSLRPLLAGEDLRPEREQLWVRRDAASPWLVDLLLTPAKAGRWVFKRDHRVSLPLEAVGATSDGIPHLRPEVVLLHKAHRVRPKDEQDFSSLLPLLDASARSWLDDALALAHPDHPWRARLR